MHGPNDQDRGPRADGSGHADGRRDQPAGQDQAAQDQAAPDPAEQALPADAGRAVGVVLRVDAKVCHVTIEGHADDAPGGIDAPLRLPLRGRLFEQRPDQPTVEKRPVAVGDRVRILLPGDHEAEGGAIEEVLPRRSRLARRAARAGSEASEREQVLAANVDRVWIVSSVREPLFQPTLVDRMLAGVEREELRATVVLTKLDRDKKGEAARWLDLYRGLGYRAVGISIARGKETTDTLDELRAELHGGTTVLSGLSGVGKSSLLNHLFPGLDLRVGSLSRIRQGKHTTTHTQLIPLPAAADGSRGYVLDTPGIRNFELFGADPQALPFWFRDLEPVARRCAYRNCTHTHEPDCAVREEVEAGGIAPSRYASYVKIRAELTGAADAAARDEDA